MDRLVAVVEALRDHCPWTAALTHADLAEYLVEEAYEAVAEIESCDAAAWADVPARRADGAYPALAAELGDVLFQVVLHAAVSRAPGAPAETAGFRLDDAADALTAKMIRRNPLVLTPEGGLRPAEELAAVRPDLDGQQIMALLGIRPGPVVGRAYTHLLEWRLDEGPHEPAEAEAELRRWWAEQPEARQD